MPLNDIAERFTAETSTRTHTYGDTTETIRGHELTILHDDGAYRHLRFKSPDTASYWFDLITWPGCLTVRGDLGSAYTFVNRGDMLAFFRGKNINPDYWAQKLDAEHGSATGYEQDIAEHVVKQHVAEAIREGQAPRGIGKAVTELLRDGDFGWEDGARAELGRFEYGAKIRLSCACSTSAEFDAEGREIAVITWRHDHRGAGHFVTEKRVDGFRFDDAWEWNFRGFDWSYLWACHAIVWGIARYDEAKALPATVETVPVTTAAGVR